MRKIHAEGNRTMNYARKLRKGDKVAIVSLSSGMLGEEFCSHNIEIGVKRLKEYGLEPVFMPNALKGIEYLKAYPEARAKDLKDAFLDDSIAGIILCTENHFRKNISLHLSGNVFCFHRPGFFRCIAAYIKNPFKDHFSFLITVLNRSLCLYLPFSYVETSCIFHSDHTFMLYSFCNDPG